MSRFWCDLRLLVTVETPGGSQQIPIDKPYARIGSHRSSDVTLTETLLPGRWVYLHATPWGVECVGLFPQAFEKPRIDKRLVPGEFISFDQYRVSAEVVDKDFERRPGENVDLGQSHLGACAVVEVWADGKRTAVSHLQQPLTVVGRRHPSHFIIADDTISATHCALYCYAGRVWAVDLLSGNGTWQESRRFQAAILCQGVPIQLGDTELIFTGYESHQVTAIDRNTHPHPATPLETPGAKTSEVLRDFGSLEEAMSSTARIRSNLEARRAAFELEKKAWLDQRQELDRQLTEQAEQLERREAELEAQQCEVEHRTGTWQQERGRWEAERATRQHQLDQQAAELARRQKEFLAMLATAPAIQPTEPSPAAERPQLEHSPEELIGQQEPAPGPDDDPQSLSSDKTRDSTEPNAGLDGRPSKDLCEEMSDRLIKLSKRKRQLFPFWKHS